MQDDYTCETMEAGDIKKTICFETVDNPLPDVIEDQMDNYLPSSGRVLVAMSGGVDSSMAAWLLKKRSLYVAGATLRLFSSGRGDFSPETITNAEMSIQRAREVCRQLEIAHQVIDCTDPFQEKVMEPFCHEYAVGRTPNPCVQCNLTIKWGYLLAYAKEAGFQYLASGHYSRIRKEAGRYQIIRGRDKDKDQSYALYVLTQEVLKHALFPLGGLTKRQVRTLASSACLCTHNTPESQDICFIPDGDYRNFLAGRMPIFPGPIYNAEGSLLGSHKGLPYYTVGQRKGLDIPFGERLFVLEKRVKDNSLIVGTREFLGKHSFDVDQINWVSRPCPHAGKVFTADVKLRYRSRPIPSEIRIKEDQKVHIRLFQHDQAIAPGQSAVWYHEDILLGGGIIQG